MIRFTVDIYDYTNDNTVTYIIGGYNYADGQGWHSTSAQCISKFIIISHQEIVGSA